MGDPPDEPARLVLLIRSLPGGALRRAADAALQLGDPSWRARALIEILRRAPRSSLIESARLAARQSGGDRPHLLSELAAVASESAQHDLIPEALADAQAEGGASLASAILTIVLRASRAYFDQLIEAAALVQDPADRIDFPTPSIIAPASSPQRSDGDCLPSRPPAKARTAVSAVAPWPPSSHVLSSLHWSDKASIQREAATSSWRHCCQLIGRSRTGRGPAKWLTDGSERIAPLVDQVPQTTSPETISVLVRKAAPQLATAAGRRRFTTLVGRASEEDQTRALRMAGHVRSPNARFTLLSDLAGVVRQPVLRYALLAAGRTRHGDWAQVVARASEVIPGPLIPTAIRAVEAQPDVDLRISALAALARREPGVEAVSTRRELTWSAPVFLGPTTRRGDLSLRCGWLASVGGGSGRLRGTHLGECGGSRARCGRGPSLRGRPIFAAATSVLMI